MVLRRQHKVPKPLKDREAAKVLKGAKETHPHQAKPSSQAR
jgi:hypothetical protein